MTSDKWPEGIKQDWPEGGTWGYRKTEFDAPDDGEVRVVGEKSWDKPAAAPAGEPANVRDLDHIEIRPTVKLDRADEIEGMVLRESHSVIKEALDLAEHGVSVFCARRSVPAKYSQTIVGLREILSDIEREQAVFDRKTTE
jgi:hypothetical protein